MLFLFIFALLLKNFYGCAIMSWQTKEGEENGKKRNKRNSETS